MLRRNSDAIRALHLLCGIVPTVDMQPAESEAINTHLTTIARSLATTRDNVRAICEQAEIPPAAKSKKQ